MIANAGGYEEITYQPRGRSWFVLSVIAATRFYYEKVMFSCGERIVNILAIAYPVAETRPVRSGSRANGRPVQHRGVLRSSLTLEQACSFSREVR